MKKSKETMSTENGLFMCLEKKYITVVLTAFQSVSRTGPAKAKPHDTVFTSAVNVHFTYCRNLHASLDQNDYQCVVTDAK